jgi:PAS domain S-box-containing protein
MGNSFQSVEKSGRFLEGFITDITKEVELQKLLQESEEKNKSIIQHMHEGVMLTDENGIVIDWNEKMGSLLPLPGSEVIGKSIFSLLERIIDEKVILVDKGRGKHFFNGIYSEIRSVISTVNGKVRCFLLKESIPIVRSRFLL